MTGETLTIGTVRVALVLYVVALLSRLLGGRPWERTTRGLWTTGLVFYLAHVAAAFHWVHAWSHQRALAETARQTEEIFGIASGSGLWFNHLFTAVWTVDTAWWWLDETGHRRRARWVSVALHSFMALMFFNGAVVFARGFSRWFGFVATALLVVLWLHHRGSGGSG